MIVAYAFRIVRRGWQKYVLSLLSLTLTATLVTLIVGMSQSAGQYLLDQNRIILGGDLAVESNFAIDESALFDSLSFSPLKTSREQSFSGTLRRGSSTLSVSFRVVDDTFPLYGSLALREGAYTPLKEDEILLDTAASEKLTAVVNDTVTFGTTSYLVVGIITREPDALFTGFRFLPRVTLSQGGFVRSGVPATFLRAEYTNRYLTPVLTETQSSALRARGEALQVRVSIAGQSGSRLVQGLDTVERFLTVAVLISAILAMVNVYASTLYLVTKLRRSFAVLRALGLTTKKVRGILYLVFGFIVLCATAVGLILGTVLTDLVRGYAAANFDTWLPAVFSIRDALLVFFVVSATSIAACVPALDRFGRMTPQALLMHTGEGGGKDTDRKKRYGVTVLAFAPLLIVSILLLDGVLIGLEVVGGVLVVYGAISIAYRAVLATVYRYRHRFSFGVRSIIAQKKYDGLFGVVSFTSLFVALTAVCTLALTESSLTTFLSRDLDRTLPSVYVLDVQPTQKDDLMAEFPNLVLFPNVRARILSIDTLQVQDAVERRDEGVDRELGREFNITYRTDLLSSETIVAGEPVLGKPGEFSVEQEFAKRANIKLGSRIVLQVQGFRVEGTVTSFRSADTRSGLPFFYFVLPPSDLERYPATYFGYAYLTKAQEQGLSSFVARTLPNVTIINTRDAGELAGGLIRTLLLIVLVIVLPPLTLACMLIVALVILTYSARRRDGARLLALGADPRYIEGHYLSETLSTTLIAALTAYLCAVGTTWYLTTRVLAIGETTYFTAQIMYTVGGILLGVLAVGAILWRSDRRPLARVLAYEENY